MTLSGKPHTKRANDDGPRISCIPNNFRAYLRKSVTRDAWLCVLDQLERDNMPPTRLSGHAEKQPGVRIHTTGRSQSS